MLNLRAFALLECAHVLGQRWALSHTHTHLLLLRHGLRARNAREVLGQLPRSVFGLLGSLVGRVPTGWHRLGQRTTREAQAYPWPTCKLL